MLLPYSFQLLTADDKIQTKVLATSNNLKILELSAISLDLLEELSSVLCFLRSFPNLEKLKITMFPEEAYDTGDTMEFLKVQDYSKVLLNRLQDVKLISISGNVPEMALIKLLLEKSLTLKRMVISGEELLDKNRS
ncbi:unnamed protein product [Fraxinus pennsylvanica]|uniref:FBD domain-containing protein n=1 Tax=Fraxinus pennsylvanica TaxID=56036 RepID=A0AAD1ZGX0_9LAMI|nr:unnamed protein product [Fraxinus pennsylvanica]